MPQSQKFYPFRGDRLTLLQISALTGVAPKVIRKRIKAGWPDWRIALPVLERAKPLVWHDKPESISIRPSKTLSNRFKPHEPPRPYNPPRKRRVERFNVAGVNMTIRQIASLAGLSIYEVYIRTRHGIRGLALANGPDTNDSYDQKSDGLTRKARGVARHNKGE